MSANVVAGYKNPTRKPHPAMKFTMLVVLLAVVSLGLPRSVVASQPAVQAPTGPKSGSVFTGAYTFVTYIYCDSGLNLNSSYTGNLDGTNTYNFLGAPDGSLLLSINGGGAQLLTSCGDPFASPASSVATYVVTKGTPPPPTPTPTPPPTPTPTPVSTPTPTPPVTPVSGGGNSGGASGAAGGPAPTTNTPTPQPGTTAEPSPTPTSSTSPSPSPPIVAIGTKQPPSSPAKANLRLPGQWPWFLAILVLVLASGLLWRSERARTWTADTWFKLRLRLAPRIFTLKTRIKRYLEVKGRDLPRRKHLAAHRHSGKIMAHHHTSYPALAFLFIFSTVILAAYSTSSLASVSSQLSLTVLGPAPTSIPTIDDPADGDIVTSSIQTVRGTCETSLIVEIYRNGSFAGSAYCDGSGLYAALITLTAGQNDLMARHVDGLGQAGPDSALTTLTYNPPPPPTPTPIPSTTPNPPPTIRPTPSTRPTTTPKPVTVAPLVIDTDQHYYLGGQPTEPIDFRVTVRGGSLPYSSSWDWGDGSSQVITSVDGKVSASHAYKDGGNYRLVIRVRDNVGREAAISLLVVVNGANPATGMGITRSGELPGILMIAWPIIGFAGLLILSFWLGERHKLQQARPLHAVPQNFTQGIT